MKLRDLEHTTSILVTHQIRDAFYIATHEACSHPDGIQIVTADTTRSDNAEFMVLHERRLHFEGTAGALMASSDTTCVSSCTTRFPPGRWFEPAHVPPVDPRKDGLVLTEPPSPILSQADSPSPVADPRFPIPVAIPTPGG